MKKEKIITSWIIITLMLLIQFCSLIDRANFESNRKQIYLSVNATNIRNSGLFFPSVLADYKKSGISYVTVSPKTVSDYEKLGKLSSITYSSLSINEDIVSRSILEALLPHNIPEKATVVISSSISMSEYLRSNFSSKYEKGYFIEEEIDENTMVFCFPMREDKDIVVGYDIEELYLIKEAGLKPCIEYPFYSYTNEAYPQFLKSFIEEYEPQFFILRKSENDGGEKLSKGVLQVLRESGMFLTVFENENQISNEKTPDYDKIKKAFSNNIVRGFNMDKVVSYDETKYKYRYYQWYNSVLERNTTFLNVNILENEGTIIDDNLILTCQAVKTFKEKMGKLGYTFPNSPEPVLYTYKLQTSAMCGVVILLVLIYLYVMLFSKEEIKDIETSFLLGCATLIILSFMFYESITKFYALLTMIVVASLITLIMFKLQASDLPPKKAITGVFLSTAALMLTGIISITALVSDFDFFLGDKWFFGVKISLLAPIAFTALNYYQVYIKTKEKLKECLIELKNKIKKIPVYIICMSGVLFVAVLAYYLIRTGKSDLILPVEDKIRKTLTDVFIIRPRFKEFLIGYPSFFLFIYFSFLRKQKELSHIFGITSIILFTSVLNIFCHTFTVLWVNSARVLTGLVSGIAVSGIIIGISEIIILIYKKKPFKFFKNFFKKA